MITHSRPYGAYTEDMMSSPNSESTERLGEFLVRIGAMTEDQVTRVLEIQKEKPDVIFGQIAIEEGFIEDSAIDAFLAAKRGGETPG